MKIQKLARLAKKHETLQLIDERDDQLVARQLAVVGSGIYPLDGMPELDVEKVLRVLDVPADDWKNWSVSRKNHTQTSWQLCVDTSPEDREATLCGVRIGLPTKVLVPVYTQAGMVFVNADQLSAISDEKDVTWWSRETDAGMVLVAKRGYMMVAVIGPEPAMDEQTLDDLWNIANAGRRVSREAAERSRRKDGEQETMAIEGGDIAGYIGEN